MNIRRLGIYRIAIITAVLPLAFFGRPFPAHAANPAQPQIQINGSPLPAEIAAQAQLQADFDRNPQRFFEDLGLGRKLLKEYATLIFQQKMKDYRTAHHASSDILPASTLEDMLHFIDRLSAAEVTENLKNPEPGRATLRKFIDEQIVLTEKAASEDAARREEAAKINDLETRLREAETRLKSSVVLSPIEAAIAVGVLLILLYVSFALGRRRG